MQLTGWENANNVRNATCATSKTSKVPTQDALLFTSYSMTMVLSSQGRNCWGGGGIWRVWHPPRLKNSVVVGQFANLQGNILHGQFSPTFAILREKYIWWEIQIEKKPFNEHCSKASTFAELARRPLRVFQQICKRDTILRDRMKQVENALKLRNLSKTRWVYRNESIEAESNYFEAIRKALTEVTEKDNNETTDFRCPS